jgi:hypothetical protein
MLFKKKISVTDYCTGKLTALFSQEREATWDSLRARCNDAALNQADKNLYYDNLRAIMVRLMVIATVKHCNWESDTATRLFISDYLKKRNLTEIDSLSGEYSQAFGSSYTDGVAPMVHLFAHKVTQSKMGEPTKRQFHAEFYGILKMLFEEFKSIKLVRGSPSVTTPESVVAEGIADLIGKSFSSTQFTELFKNATLSEGWTPGDALAAWYSLGNLALIVAVWTTYDDKAKAPPIIDLCRSKLRKHWNMPADIFEKFLTVVGETEASAFTAFTRCKDGTELSRFFGRYVSRILGAPVPFSERSMFEDQMMGFKYRSEPILKAEVCGFFMDICSSTKKLLEKYPLGVGL